jgi:hypothetical protein
MKKTTIIFNLILGLSGAILLTGCGSPDENPSEGSGEGVRPVGLENAPVTSKDGKDTMSVAKDTAPQALPIEPLGNAKKGTPK